MLGDGLRELSAEPGTEPGNSADTIGTFTEKVEREAVVIVVAVVRCLLHERPPSILVG
jgi:hypothetical protein